ncbi:MAG: hypothetical protein KDJ16_05865 [Hyphomicrobiales bacterium]|nr:hypothetical protein [Hyphomicrobiales bacterium]
MKTPSSLRAHVHGALAGLTLVVWTTGVGLAASSEELVQRWIDGLNAAGKVEMTVGDIGSGLLSSAVTLSDVTVNNTETGATTHADEVVLDGVEESGDGNTVAESIVVTNFTAKDEETDVTIETITVTNAELRVPAEGDEDDAPFGKPAGFAFTGMTVVDDGKPPVPVESGQFELSDLVDGKPNRVKVKINGIAVPTEIIDEEPERAMIEAMGYTTLNLSIDGEFHYSGEGVGEGVIDRFVLTLADGAELSIAGSVGGIPRTALENPEASAELLMQTATLNRVSISIANDSLVDRVIEQQAKAAGMGVDDFKTQMKALVPAMLAALEAPEFQAEASAAISAFLDDPKNLTVAAVPAAPVLIAQIIGIGMQAPGQIPAMLGVTVSANE